MDSKGSSKLPNTDSKESTKGTGPQRSRHEAIAILAEFGAVIKRASKLSSVYADFEKILDQKSDLESQISDMDSALAKKGERIRFLEAHHQENIGGFEKRYADWAKDEAVRRQQITSAKTHALADLEAKHKKEVEKLKRELVRGVETSKKNETRLQGLLDFSRAGLEEWEGKLSILKEMDVVKFTEQFQELVQRYMDVMKSNFLKGLPDRLLADRPRWEKLRRTLAFPLSLPTSNTAAAKNARLTAALWTLSPLLSDYIFAPCRIHADPSDNRTIKALLHQQLHIGVRQENMVRSLLLSAYPHDEEGHARWGAVDFTIKEGQSSLGQMLEDPEKLRQGLQPVFDGFAGLWEDALFSKKFVFASTEEDSAWEWGDVPEFDDDFPLPDMPPPAGEPLKFSTLNLFPRVFIPDSDEEIHPGILVWTEQKSIVASEAEYRKELYDRQNGSSGNRGGPAGPPLRRPRRHSTVDGGGSSRGGSVRSSSAIGKMPGNRHSFLGGPGPQMSDATGGSRGSGGPPSS
ncbi:MAG: hypothetical protein M1840_002584 [Geoglossum simile]|nr:MAG: hypothetical protein M1840_002584 [Geoglossum simile]